MNTFPTMGTASDVAGTVSNTYNHMQRKMRLEVQFFKKSVLVSHRFGIGLPFELKILTNRDVYAVFQELRGVLTL